MNRLGDLSGKHIVDGVSMLSRARRELRPSAILGSLILLLSLGFLTWLGSSPCWGGQTIYVKILVDDEEVFRDELWKQRLRLRLEKASEIIHAYTKVRFSVIAFDRWDSDDNLREFVESLREFESKAQCGPARIAIGFTSQYQLKQGRDQLGGTRGAMHSHILVREGNPKVYEPDRLEVLVHELGHFLGAAHSPDQDSVMRPVVADGRARLKKFQIRFDRENGEIMRLVGLEIANRDVHQLSEVSPKVRSKLMVQYGRIASIFPEDESARKFMRLLESSGNTAELPVSPLSVPFRPGKLPNPTVPVPRRLSP